MWTVVVQAGGASRRMGRNKALIPFGGQPLIARVVERVEKLADELFVIADGGDDYNFLGVPIVEDLVHGYGPLGGVNTAFYYAKNLYVLIVACDMPFLNADLLRWQQNLLISENYDVVVPSLEKGLEPLHAVYRRENCLLPARRAMEAGEKRAVSWFAGVAVREISEEEVRQVDKRMLSFWNINTETDLELAKQLYDQDQSS